MTQNQDKTSGELPNFDAMWDYSNPAATADRFRELLPTAEQSGNVDYHAQLLTQLARTQGLQRKFDEAHAILDEVEPMLTEDTPTARVRYLLERGRTINSGGDPVKSREYFLKAYNLAMEQEDIEHLVLDAAHMMAIVEEPEKQVAWSLKSIAVAESSDNPRVKGWLGPLYNNVGWTYHDMNDYETALAYFEKGLEFRRSVNDVKGAIIAKWTIARCYRSLERYDEAMQLQFEIVKDYEEAGIENSGYSYEELGELYLINGDKSLSQKYFGMAYEILSRDEWLQANEAERLERMKQLSE